MCYWEVYVVSGFYCVVMWLEDFISNYVVCDFHFLIMWFVDFMG